MCKDEVWLSFVPSVYILLLSESFSAGWTPDANCLRFCPPDRVSASAVRGPGAGGDRTEVSAEWSLGRGPLWSLWRANQSSAAGLPVIQPSLAWFKKNKKSNNNSNNQNKRKPPAQNGIGEGWSVSLLPATEIWIRDLSAELPEGCSGMELKSQQGNSRTAVYTPNHCIPAESSNLINKGHRLCLEERSGRRPHGASPSLCMFL